MINKDTLLFLKDLKNNNLRDWFEDNKMRYVKARENVEWLVGLIIHELAQYDPVIKGLQARDCLFRIYRDVRFSKDKSPYKTNFGAYIAPGGKKSPHAAYYFHLEPGASFFAGGLYMPATNILRRVRAEIIANPDELKDVLEDPGFRKYFGELSGEKLKRPPQGVPAGFPYTDWLQHKSFLAFRNVGDDRLVSENFLKEATDTYRAMLPLNRFLNLAVEKETYSGH